MIYILYKEYHLNKDELRYSVRDPTYGILLGIRIMVFCWGSIHYAKGLLKIVKSVHPANSSHSVSSRQINVL